jgi:hypothetical protein
MIGNVETGGRQVLGQALGRAMLRLAAAVIAGLRR